MKIHYIGHSGFIVENGPLRIGVDVWLENPTNSLSVDEVEKLDYLFLSHDHFDHGRKDMIEIAKRDGSTFICHTDTATDIISKKELPEDQVIGANIGGTFKVGDLQVILTQAHHSSDTGEPTGIIVTFPDNTVIYHLGDTGYFSELEFYGKLYEIDLMFVPIGGFYTMDPKIASFAVGAIKPKFVIPMHHNTFPPISIDPNDFLKNIETQSLETEVKMIAPGENLNL